MRGMSIITLAKSPVHLERERLLREHLPDLFSAKYKTVLYVGANKRRQHFVDAFEDGGYERITIVEIFADNVEFLRTKFTDRSTHSIIHGDVRDIERLGVGNFDVIFYWHGIDLLPRDDIEPTLKKLENLGGSLIVLGLPHGIFPKDDTVFDNNQNEDHISPVYPDFLKDLGYETIVHGPKDTVGSSIMAWKHLS